MSDFAFSAIPVDNAAASLVTGRREASDESALRDALRAEGLIAVEVKPVGLADLFARRSAPDRLRASEAAWFFQTLRLLLENKVPIEEAIGSMEALAPSRRVRAACAAARADLRAGSTLAEALGARPGLTSAQQRALLRSGQESGRLDHAVALIDHAIGSAARLRRALVGRLIYPLILLIAAVGAVWLLSARVIPQFADTLASLGGELPWQTELTLALGSRLTWALPALAALAVGAWLARPLWLTPALRARLAAWALRVPVLGSLLWHAQAAMITDVVATMIRGGADLLSGLREAHEVVSSPVIAERLELARRDVREGADLAEALADRAVLPPMINAVVGAGLRAGDLAGALRRASDLCAERQEHVAGRLLVFLEPGVILLLAGAVGWVVYSLVIGMLAVTDAGGL